MSRARTAIQHGFRATTLRYICVTVYSRVYSRVYVAGASREAAYRERARRRVVRRRSYTRSWKLFPAYGHSSSRIFYDAFVNSGGIVPVECDA